jgi:phenylalanyl-tRNA synthetase beta chain
MRHSRLALLLGLEVEPLIVRRIFESMELGILKETRTRITVSTPSWRGDLEREIDLIEEVARIHGYERIGETTRMPVKSAPLTRRQRCERIVRRLLAGEGFDEVVTYSLVAPAAAQLAQPWHEGQPIGLRNPVTLDRTHLRLTLMANLLAIKKFNASYGTERLDIFEIGRIYLPRKTAADEQPQEKLCLTILTDRDGGFLLLKGALANVLEALRVEGEMQEEPAQVATFAQDESLVLKLDGRPLGCLGVVRQETADELDLKNRPALLEVDFDLIVGKARIEPAVKPVPTYPSIRRDIAVVVDEAVRWAEVRQCVQQSAPGQLEAFELFDVYHGQQVPPGKKSLAFALTFRAPDRTLTNDEADAARDRVVSALKDCFNAQLR